MNSHSDFLGATWHGNGCARAIQFMGDRTGLSLGAFRGERRGQEIAFPRIIAMWLCVEALPSTSMSMIGRAFGRERTTITHARDRIRFLRATREDVLYLTDHLLAEFRRELLNPPTLAVVAA